MVYLETQDKGDFAENLEIISENIYWIKYKIEIELLKGILEAN